MFIYSIRYRDGCGRWSVAFAQAASQSDAEAIATCRYGAFHSVSRAGSVPFRARSSVTAKKSCCCRSNIACSHS